jgi:DNA-binding NtrC family response regulator
MTRILIIDDDRHMRNACSRALSKEGWEILCAETGDEGLEMLANSAEDFDAVLLDHLMPGISGMDALDKIKELHPNLPVIIMTGSVTEDMAGEIIRKGASDCLPKPFIPAQLRSIIRNVTEQPHNSETTNHTKSTKEKQ